MLRVEKVVDATTETLLGINLPMNISGTLAVARASVRMKLAPTVCSTFLSIRVIWAFDANWALSISPKTAERS